MERLNDRRVISGIVHVLKSGCRWCDCPPSMGLQPQSITGLFAESGVASGRTFPGACREREMHGEAMINSHT